MRVKEPSFYLLREGLDELRRKHPANTTKKKGKSSIVLKQETHESSSITVVDLE